MFEHIQQHRASPLGFIGDAEDADMVYGGSSEGYVALDEALDTEAAFHAENAASDSKVRQATVSSSVFNLVNTVVGTGLLAFPFAMKLCGMLLGSTFLIGVAVLGVFSTHLLVETLHVQTGGRFNRNSYASMASFSLGKVGVLLANMSMALACFGAGASYLVILGDLIGPIVEEIGGLEEDSVKRSYVILSVLVVLGPLAALRRLDSLRFASVVALLSVGYLIGAISFEGMRSINRGFPDTCGAGDCVKLAVFSRDFLRSIPLIAFGFTCHPSLPAIFSELREPSKRRFRQITATTFATSGFLYLVVACFGYLIFFGDTKSNVLKNFDDPEVHIWLAIGGISVTVLLSFPLLALPLFSVLEEVLFKATPENPAPLHYHLGLVAIVIAAQVLIGILVDDVSLVFGIVGSTASTMISFILPAAFYIQTSRKLGIARTTSPTFIGAVILLVCGCVFMVAATVVTIVDAGSEDRKDDADNLLLLPLHP